MDEAMGDWEQSSQLQQPCPPPSANTTPSRKDSASIGNLEKASFDHDNIVPSDQYRPATGLRRAEPDHDGGSAEFGNGHTAIMNTEYLGISRESNREILGGSNAADAQAGLEDEQYNLRPPLPSTSHDNVESLAVRLFSVDHLNLILRDPIAFPRFKRFLEEHRTQDLPALYLYRETRKAIMAIDYANAIALSVAFANDEEAQNAVVVDETFKARSQEACDQLVDESLPAYITHRFVSILTDALVKEITGNNAPIFQELVPSLAEVYCLTDPSLPDNPIVYASEEFYNTTQYGRDYAIGRNCRFLQGPKTSNSSIHRLGEALDAGREAIETVLNYRRDGTPFLNMVYVAPLYDNKGKIRYHLGCLIDVSGLVTGGMGLESFVQLIRSGDMKPTPSERPQKRPEELLGGLGAMLDEDEIRWMKSTVERLSDKSLCRNSSDRRPPSARRSASRLVLGMHDASFDQHVWSGQNNRHLDRAPTVFQNYVLVRPFPSLRITFTSPALRIPGLVQSRLMDRIGGPQHVREGIYAALGEGTSFTAKVHWFTNSHSARMDFANRRTQSQDTAPNPGPGRGPVAQGLGKTRWIHCTPLLGSDDRVGVWMVVMVEQEEVTGKLNVSRASQRLLWRNLGRVEKDSERSDDKQIYAEYLWGKRDQSQVSSTSMQEGKEVDYHFRDF